MMPNGEWRDMGQTARLRLSGADFTLRSCFPFPSEP